MLLRLIKGYDHGPGSEYPSVVNPSKIVLSVGLCDNNLALSTSVINFKKIFLEIKAKFPKSHIFVHEIQFSSLLDPRKTTMLGGLNNFLAEDISKRPGFSLIPKINPNDYATSVDNIHWTHPCANKTYQHILDS